MTLRCARGRPEGRKPGVTPHQGSPTLSAVDAGVPLSSALQMEFHCESRKWAKVHPDNSSSPSRAQLNEPSPQQGQPPTRTLGAHWAPRFPALTTAVMVLLFAEHPTVPMPVSRLQAGRVSINFAHLTPPPHSAPTIRPGTQKVLDKWMRTKQSERALPTLAFERPAMALHVSGESRDIGNKARNRPLVLPAAPGLQEWKGLPALGPEEPLL